MKKLEKLNEKVVGTALGFTSAIVYIVCAVWYSLAPKGLITYGNYLFHGTDLDSIARKSATFSNVIVGLILIFISGYLVGTLFVKLYNYFNKKF